MMMQNGSLKTGPCHLGLLTLIFKDWCTFCITVPNFAEIGHRPIPLIFCDCFFIEKIHCMDRERSLLIRHNSVITVTNNWIKFELLNIDKQERKILVKKSEPWNNFLRKAPMGIKYFDSHHCTSAMALRPYRFSVSVWQNGGTCRNGHVDLEMDWIAVTLTTLITLCHLTHDKHTCISSCTDI